MFVELNKNNYFVQYHENKKDVSPEHTDFVIEVTNELFDALQSKMPWSIGVLEDRVYSISDIDLFVEIPTAVGSTLDDYLLDLDFRLSSIELEL